MLRKVFTHYIFWFFGVTLLFVLQLVLSFSESGFKQPILTSTYLEYLVFNLAWISSLSLPLAGLLGSSSAYISELLKKTGPQRDQDKLGADFPGLTAFLTPAIILGICIALLCLLTCLFAVPYANSRITGLTHNMRAEVMASDRPKSDREMTVGELLKQASQVTIEVNRAEKQNRTEARIKRNQLMVEVYKRFAIPLSGFILPVLGSLMAIVLSKRRTGRRIILFLFDVFILILIWILLVAGEAWGNNGILPPSVSMFLTPCIAMIIVVSLWKRSGELLVSPETKVVGQ